MGHELSSLGEFGLIDLFRRDGSAHHDWALTGMGDDCAVLDLGANERLLVTTDVLVEGTHFTRATTAAAQLGHKALAVSLSDVAAMGGQPVAVFLNSAWTSDLSQSWVAEFRDGLLGLAERFGVDLLGGDTVAAEGALSVGTMVLGRGRAGQVIRRSGAQVGDGIFVGRALGDSAAGLELLRREDILKDRAERQALLAAHLIPEPQVALGRWLATHGRARAMIDISDGLLKDLDHLCQGAGLGADLVQERLPLSPALRQAAQALGCDPLDWALSGGEDFCLLFCVPQELVSNMAQSCLAELGEHIHHVGQMVERPGLCLERAGTLSPVAALGYDHFPAPRTE